MKTFNHCDENFLSFDSVRKTSLLGMKEKAFLQMGKWPSSLIRQSSAEGRWKCKRDAACRVSKKKEITCSIT